jgi:hypothetical protein
MAGVASQTCIQMTQFTQTYRDLALGRSWRMTVPHNLTVSPGAPSTDTPNIFIVSTVNDILTFRYASNLKNTYGLFYQISVGDFIYNLATGTLFVVLTKSGILGGSPTYYEYTAQQQNNITVTPNIYGITGRYDNSSGVGTINLPVPAYNFTAGNTFSLNALNDYASLLNGQWTAATVSSDKKTITFDAGAGLHSGGITWTSGQFCNGFIKNNNPDQTLAGYSVVVKTGIWLPAKLAFGTFSTSSATISSAVDRADGYGGDLDTYYSVNDRLFSPQQNSVYLKDPWAIPSSGVTISGISNGSPGSMTISGANPIVNGIFPIFPFEIR